jgi:hypothetical protein
MVRLRACVGYVECMATPTKATRCGSAAGRRNRIGNELRERTVWNDSAMNPDSVNYNIFIG